MLICLSGRLGSGKTLLSSQLIMSGFTRVSFADYLKILVAKTYKCDVSLLKDEGAKKEILDVPWTWDDATASRLFKLAKINYKFDIEPQIFTTRREALQYIGTDVLKKYDENFHARKLMENINSGDFVCDDLRFEDELSFIKNENTKCYHIIRPSNFNVSNHKSETSLNWSLFENIIINNKSVENLQKDFLNTIKNAEVINYKIQKYLPFLYANKTNAYYAGILSQVSQYKLKPHDTNKAFISLDKLDSYRSKFLSYEINSVFKDEDIFSSAECLNCPYIMENLKLWKPESDGIPMIIKNNDFLIKHWNDGILKGKALLL